MFLKYEVPCQKAAKVGQVGRCHHGCRAVNSAVCMGGFGLMVLMTVLRCIFETLSKEVSFH